MRDILHDLKKIQGKLQENFTWKGTLEEQKQGELLLFCGEGLTVEAEQVFQGFIIWGQEPRGQLRRPCGVSEDGVAEVFLWPDVFLDLTGHEM